MQFNKSKRRAVLTFAAVVVSASVALAGCASSSGTAAKQKTIGITLLSLQYPFLVNLDNAAKAQAAKDDVKLISLDPRQSTATELSQIQDLIAQKVDLIEMVPVDQKVSQRAALLVNKAKIPLVLVNTSFQSFPGKYVTYVGSDDTSAGVIEGNYLAKTLPNGGNVIYLTGVAGQAGTTRREAGFNSVVSKDPDLKIVSSLSAGGSRAQGKSVMQDLLQKYPKGSVQAVVAQSDEMAIGASEAIAEAGRQSDFKVVVGIDGSAAGLAAVKSGAMTATVFQNAVGQGQKAVTTAVKILDGKKVPKVVNLPFELVTKSNLSKYLKN